MRIKTLTAPTMPDALRLIREQLGPEALILGTRKVPGADGKMTLEITAALDEPEPVSKPIALPSPRTDLPAPAPAPAGGSTHPLAAPLRQHGVAESLITRLLAALPGLVEAGFSEAEAVEMLLTRFAMFKPWGDILTPGRAHVLVGPHGAGKTTLVAKLALHTRQQGRSVGLLSLDNQKVAGIEPLAVVAEMLGDTAHLVTNTATLRAAAAEMGPRHMVLIDTPGLNPYQPHAVTQLTKQIEDLGLPTTVHLVVPANLNGDDMALLPVAAHALNLASLIVTRLDATSRFGAILSTAAAANLPLGLATHSGAFTTPPLSLTAQWMAQAITQYPAQPWEFPA